MAGRRTSGRPSRSTRLSESSMQRYLLDTGLLLGFIREAPWALSARESLNLGDPETMVFTSVICKGEILALAEKNGWGSNRRRRLDRLLHQIPSQDISSEKILSAYALIDAWTHGKSVDSPHATPPPRPAVPMKQNDLWIAATAHASRGTLVSTDDDFEHLDQIWLTFVFVNQEAASS